MARYPFFAGAAVLAGLTTAFGCCGRGVIGAICGGLISADIWNKNVCIPVLFSSCFVSLISTFWK
jgi:hypothetical protein